MQNKVIRYSLAVSFTGDGVKRINYITHPVIFPALNPDFIIAKPPAKPIANYIRNSINAFTFPP